MTHFPVSSAEHLRKVGRCPMHTPADISHCGEYCEGQVRRGKHFTSLRETLTESEFPYLEMIAATASPYAPVLGRRRRASTGQLTTLAEHSQEPSPMSSDQDMPKWDVALAALAADEYRRTGKPLTLDDFRNLAKTYSIRLDDIMETMLLLAVNREWAYTDPAGIVREINQDTLDSLFKKRRLNEDDLATIDGTWQPASE